MSQNKICLASDNWTPTHPSIMKSVVDANKGYTLVYGSDFKDNEIAEFCLFIAFGTGYPRFGVSLSLEVSN